jgi:hypothetical protein
VTVSDLIREGAEMVTQVSSAPRVAYWLSNIQTIGLATTERVIQWTPNATGRSAVVDEPAAAG